MEKSSFGNFFGVVICLAVLVVMIFLAMRFDEREFVKADSETTAEETVNGTPGETYVAQLALPAKIYGFIGQPVKIYFLNLTEYNSLENITFEVESDVNGTTNETYWEYVAQSAGTVDITVNAYDSAGKLINKGTTTIEIMDKSQSDSLSLLVIGDSTIASNVVTETLVSLSDANDYDLTLYGTQGNDYNRHEGRGGWSTEAYVRKYTSSSLTNAFYNPETEIFDFKYYMRGQGDAKLDCVCIQLGINDVFGATSDEDLDAKVSAYFDNMDYIINEIHSYDENIKIVWNMVLPGSPEQAKFEEAYGTQQTADRYKRNTYLANLKIIEKYSNASNIYIAPINMTLNTIDNMSSGGNGAVHPSTAGYTEIGTMLYAFIRAIN